MMHFLFGCTNSIGSSIVMTWSLRDRLTRSMSEHRVVDFPDPVGPVTSTRPLFNWQSFWTSGVIPICSTVTTVAGIWRKTAAWSATVLERVGAESRDAFELVRVVGVVRIGVLSPIPLGHDRSKHRVEPERLEGRLVEPMHLAVQAQDGRLAAAQVQVGRTFRDHGAQQDVEHGSSTIGAVEVRDGVGVGGDAAVRRGDEPDGGIGRRRRRIGSGADWAAPRAPPISRAWSTSRSRSRPASIVMRTCHREPSRCASIANAPSSET
jgi:hypothetical protein